MMNKKLISLAIICLTLVGVLQVSSSLVLAQSSSSPEPTPEASPQSSPQSTETTQKLKERIERIVEEKRDQIKGVLSEFEQQRRGTIGEVVRVSEEAITFKNVKGTHIVPFDDTLVLLKSGNPIEIESIAVGDWVVVMGIIENDTFKPKRILVSSTTLRPKTHLVELGSVEEITRTSLTLKPRSGEESVTVKLDSNTDYQDIEGETSQRTDISEETQALVVGYQDDDEKIATTIKILSAAESNQ